MIVPSLNDLDTTLPRDSNSIDVSALALSTIDITSLLTINFMFVGLAT